jgi:hypothetical protein
MTTTAHAAVFSWDASFPNFSDIVGANSNRSQSGTADIATLNWGFPTSRNPGLNSGYKMNALDGTLNIDPGQTLEFIFGVFTHSNWDINGTTANGLALDSTKLSFNLTLNGLLFTPIFNIDHTETLNNYANFPACCNDLVKSNSIDLGSFVQDGLKYAVTLAAIDMNNREQTNSAMQWKGKVTLEEVAPIPIPAAAPLFAAGLAGLGYMSRRRKV